MLEPYDKVVLGVSGGADSVCLLFVLLEYAREIPLELSVVHVNHGIRQEAEQDAAFVRELCDKHGPAYFQENADVAALAKEWHMSEEEAGRIVRYRAFERVAKETGATKIAVAHNSNDNAETLLFHLFRGSGIRGLGGIRPVREGIIRPLLCLERKEIEAFLQELGVAYCEDRTNSGDDYTRNRIRHHILPYAEAQVSGGVVASMGRTARILRETEDYLERQTHGALKHCVAETDTGYCLETEAFRKEDPVLQKRMLNQLLTELAPGKKDISYVHVQDMLRLFDSEGNRSIDLPFGIRARREYGRVFLERAAVWQEPFGQVKRGSVTGEKSGFCVEIGLDTLKGPMADEEGSLTITVPETGLCMNFKVFSYKKGMKVPQNEYTKWLDYDRIDKSLSIRSRREGDYLSIRDGEGRLCHKSLKKYMVAAKIPAGLRSRIPVLAMEEHVLWLPGYRISEYFKITDNTEHVLQVQCPEMEEDDGKTSCGSTYF
ncbi:MAG: tRNA lysidine(34) synthetase TilS [Lachnospiraceae bacterium]|nr:tRNA lysidine(34) synthetase TilS [Lachnospiraceae bacterium]